MDNKASRFSGKSKRKNFEERRVIYSTIEAMAELREISADERRTV